MNNTNENLFTKGHVLATKTIISRRSHEKLFAKYNITVETLKNEGVYALDRIKVKNKPVKNGYKAQLAITAKSIYPLLEINLKQYRQNADKERRILSPNIIKKLLTIVEYAANFISGFTVEYPLSILDIANYEVCVAILLTISTMLHINEIMQLRMLHLEQILQHQTISLKTKQRT